MQQQDNSTRTACAACKHQRKKCPADCVLAPYLPGHMEREFQAVLAVYGVSNFVKLIQKIDHLPDRSLAAQFLVWVAMCWQSDPVLGPCREFLRLQHEVERLKHVVEILQWQTQCDYCNMQLNNVVPQFDAALPPLQQAYPFPPPQRPLPVLSTTDYSSYRQYREGVALPPNYPPLPQLPPQFNAPPPPQDFAGELHGGGIMNTVPNHDSQGSIDVMQNLINASRQQGPLPGYPLLRRQI